MATDLGSDTSTYVLNDEGERDLDPFFAEIDGPRAVAEAVMRRYETPLGMYPDDPEAGDDILEYLNADLGPDDPAFAIAHGLEREALKDERVDGVLATAAFDQAADRLRLSVQGSTAEGPFELVLEASALSVEAIKVTP